jgi:hypothetical protein
MRKKSRMETTACSLTNMHKIAKNGDDGSFSYVHGPTFWRDGEICDVHYEKGMYHKGTWFLQMHEIEKHCMFFKRSINLFFKTSNAFQCSPLSIYRMIQSIFKFKFQP